MTEYTTTLFSMPDGWNSVDLTGRHLRALLASGATFKTSVKVTKYENVTLTDHQVRLLLACVLDDQTTSASAYRDPDTRETIVYL